MLDREEIWKNQIEAIFKTGKISKESDNNPNWNWSHDDTHVTADV